jgi:predicted nuclease of predicted toxin-antitoxin system
VKILLDQNLLPRLAQVLRDVYHQCAHIREVGLERANDDQLWN